MHTRAVAAARRAGVPFALREYPAETCHSAVEAARALGIAPARMLKTLVVSSEAGQSLLALVPVSRRLDLSALAAVLGLGRCRLAKSPVAEQITGYALGAISPFGLPERLPVVIDATAADFPTLYVSAGRAGLELEIAPHDLVAACHGTFAAIAT